MNLKVIVSLFDVSEGHKDDRRFYAEQDYEVTDLRSIAFTKERIVCRMDSLRKSYPDELGGAKLQVDATATNRIHVIFAEVTDEVDAAALLVHAMAAAQKTETVR